MEKVAIALQLRSSLSQDAWSHAFLNVGFMACFMAYEAEVQVQLDLDVVVVLVVWDGVGVTLDSQSRQHRQQRFRRVLAID